uniref:Abhydrolase domain containing 17A, depalmitoylase n=2 Tax=Phasianidae TaxID=9005 RepID=A0A8V1AB55_CHICK
MNGLSISQLCCLFCCPPCPSRIAAKLAFLPPEPTYAVVPEPEPIGSTSTGSLRGGAAGRWKLHLKDRADFQYSQRELDNIEVFVTKSSRGNRIGCMYVRCVPGARYTVLFSHGNAVDLGQMSSFYIGLGTRINCNIFSYDYSGYGASTGKPSERNLYSDIDAAWQALRTRYGISPENIILYGQSIGTVPTVDLASRYECAAIVLHSPLTSGMRVAFPETKKTYWFDAFPKSPKSPLLSSSFTAPRMKSSTSPTAWRSSNAVPKPWSRCGWMGPGTMTLNSTASTSSAFGNSSPRSWPANATSLAAGRRTGRAGGCRVFVQFSQRSQSLLPGAQWVSTAPALGASSGQCVSCGT